VTRLIEQGREKKTVRLADDGENLDPDPDHHHHHHRHRHRHLLTLASAPQPKPKQKQTKNSPGRSNPFELHVSLQEVTLRMLLQLREIVPTAGSRPGGASSSGPPLFAPGASSLCGISVGNYRRLPGERGEDEVDDTTVDAEVVDAGDGDAEDSWGGLLKNSAPLQAMVSGLLAAPAAAGAARGPCPGERRRRRRARVFGAGLLGAAVAAVLGAVATKNGSGSEGGGKQQKEEKRKRK